MIVSLVSVKGGVGKTTTAVNLAAALAGSGLAVLLVDLDPQASASFSLGALEGEVSPCSADVLLDGRPLEDAIRETGVPGLHLVAGSVTLAGADLVLARRPGAQTLLHGMLAPVRRRYDVVLIDCPSGLGVIALNGLAAAEAYVVPVAPHDLAMEALNRFFDGWERLAPALDEPPALLGILLTMIDRRTRLTEEVVASIREAFTGDVFRTEIPINVRLAEAPGYGQTIFQYERWSTGARAYSRLGAEVIRRARRTGLV